MADRLMMISHGQRVLYGPVDQVRRQYATGAVSLKAKGELAALKGVEHIIQRNGFYDLYPIEGVTAQELWRQLAMTPEIEVYEFEIAISSLDDIIEVVKEKSS